MSKSSTYRDGLLLVLVLFRCTVQPNNVLFRHVVRIDHQHRLCFARVALKRKMVDPVAPDVAPDISALVTAAEVTTRISLDVLALDVRIPEDVPTLDHGHEQLLAAVDGADIDMLMAEGTLLASHERLRELPGAVRADVTNVWHRPSLHFTKSIFPLAVTSPARSRAK